jgi:hypothetical protein
MAEDTDQIRAPVNTLMKDRALFKPQNFATFQPVKKRHAANFMLYLMFV